MLLDYLFEVRRTQILRPLAERNTAEYSGVTELPPTFWACRIQHSRYLLRASTPRTRRPIPGVSLSRFPNRV